MTKVSINLVHEKMSDNNLDQETIQKVLQDIEAAAQEEAEAAKAEKGPTEKKQFVIVISDPQGQIHPIMATAGLVGWVVQIPEDDSPSTTLEKLHRAAYEFNVSKKGRKYPVKSIGEACEAVGARFLKEQGLSVKTKTPVEVIVTNNRIPEIEDDFAGAKEV